VAGVILAAGESRRLGRPKQLLDVGGEPLARRVARIALLSQLDPVTVVVGQAADQVGKWLEDLDVAVAFNPDFETGQASSIRAGLRALPSDAAAVLFLLGDQPTVTSAITDAVIAEFRASRADIVQARYAGLISGHPVLFTRSLVPELLEITGDEGGRAIIRRRDVRYVDFDEEPPPDIDTEADYQRVLTMLVGR
jgi:molybdenum cofactor cytidylyltransferase